MKIKNKKKRYVLLAAVICFTLIGLIAAYFSPNYENSVQGTHNRGMYNVLIYLQIGSILFAGIVALNVFSKHKNVMEE